MAKQVKKQKKQPMGKESKILLLVLLIVVAAVLGVRMWRSGSAEKNLAELTAGLEAAIPAEGSTVNVNGYECVALLEPMALESKLPVLQEYSDRTLTVAPAIYAGEIGQPGLVIGGSNASSHFGQLTDLFYGDLVWITAVDGTLYEYEMDELEIQKGEDPADLDSHDWDLTLFYRHKTDEFIVAGFYRTEN